MGGLRSPVRSPFLDQVLHTVNVADVSSVASLAMGRGTGWCVKEVDQLGEMVLANQGLAAIARKLHRPYSSVKKAALKLKKGIGIGRAGRKRKASQEQVDCIHEILEENRRATANKVLKMLQERGLGGLSRLCVYRVMKTLNKPLKRVRLLKAVGGPTSKV